MEELKTPTEVIHSGNALQKTGNEFTQAITIQKPRNRYQVVKACEEEAAIAGEEFYYSWTVKSQRGPVLVEGLSIGGALAAARNWGNCALPCKVEEKSDHYVFTATFIDFETGFNMQRVFKQRKEQNIGMKDTARAEDITFQIGQSKALRNVALNAMPSWLTKKMLDKAKEQVIAKITKMGLPVARQKAMEFFEKHGIEIDRVEKKMSKKQSHWNAEDLAIIQGAMSSLVNGQESADSLFPYAGEEAAVATGKTAINLKEKITAKKKSKEMKPLKTDTKKAIEETPVKESEEEAPILDEGGQLVDPNATVNPGEQDPPDPKLVDDAIPGGKFMASFTEFTELNEVSPATIKTELESLGYPEGIDQVIADSESNQNIVMEYFEENFTKDS